MTHDSVTSKLFFETAELDQTAAEKLTIDALNSADDG